MISSSYSLPNTYTGKKADHRKQWKISLPANVRHLSSFYFSSPWPSL